MRRSPVRGGEMRPEQKTGNLTQLRIQLEMVAAKRKDMQNRCRAYNPQPIHEMTPNDAKAFAVRQAEEASRTIKMTGEEMLRYASEIYQSIIRMNKADKRHKDHMRYLDECRKEMMESIKRHEQESKNKQKTEIVIY